MVRRYKDGDVEGARALNDEMGPAFDLLKVMTNPIAIKAALNLLGHEVGGYRLPMVEPTDAELDAVPRLPRARRRARTASDLGALARPRMGTCRIIPLGGLGEVGKNMTAYEAEDSS